MGLENNNSRFQFHVDGDEPETIIQDELRELKIEKLGQRVTLLTILIPCMIGVILVITYLDIKDRVTRSYDTGAVGVQKLSKDLASKFSSLSLEQAKIKETQDKKIPELEKSAAFLKSRLSDLQQSMDQITTTAINRNELTRVVDALTDKVAGVPKGLKPEFDALSQVDDQIVGEVRRISDDLKTLSDNMVATDARIAAIKKEIETLREKAIDKNDLELALKLKEIGYRQSLLDKTTLLEKEIKAIQNTLKGLQKDTGGSPATQPSPPASQKPASETEKPENSSGSAPATLESGGIVEQTIE